MQFRAPDFWQASGQQSYAPTGVQHLAGPAAPGGPSAVVERCSRASAGWWGAEDLSVGGDPVGGDHVLGRGEGDAMRAEQIVQCALEFVLGVRGGSRLGPEVRRTVGGAPQLEGYQVVEFVRRGPVALPVGGLSQTFLTVGDARGWPHGGGVAAASAYRALQRGVRDMRVDSPGRASGVR